MNGASPFGVRFTRSWVSIYTGGLPTEPGDRRRREIESDLFEHDREVGSKGVLGRSLRGIPADVWWRVRTWRESAGQTKGSSFISSNPTRKWWVALAIAHIVLTALGSVRTFIEAGTLDNVAPVAIWIQIAVLIGVVLMSVGLLIQRTRPVRGSWLVVIGAIPSIFSITGVAVLLSGFWTANLALRKSTIATGYDSLAVRNRAVMARTWWVWFITAAALFGLGWVGLYVDNWFLWILPWVSAGLLAVVGLAMGVAVYIDRHRTREA